MDQVVQIIGLTMVCLGLVGFAAAIIGITKWYAKDMDRQRANDDVAR